MSQEEYARKKQGELDEGVGDEGVEEKSRAELSLIFFEAEHGGICPYGLR